MRTGARGGSLNGVKRRDLIRAINAAASERGEEAEWGEGGRHTIVRFGGKQASIPRHREIAENTARRILEHLGIEGRKS